MIFLLFKKLFINLLFNLLLAAGSWLPCRLFCTCGTWWLLSWSTGSRACGFRSGSSQVWSSGSVVGCTGLAAPQHVGPSKPRNQTCASCIDRPILYHWATREALMSLRFNMLSRFVIAFLSRSKHLLISWLQSLSKVTLEPKKVKSALFPLSPHLFAMRWWDWMSWSSFFECWVIQTRLFTLLFHPHSDAV